MTTRAEGLLGRWQHARTARLLAGVHPSDTGCGRVQGGGV